jgi:hypothetical protein
MIHIPRDWTAHESEPEDSQHLLIASSEIVRKRLMFAEQLTIACAQVWSQPLISRSFTVR